MDKKSIRINFNFNIAKNKNGRNNSHFKTKHYKMILIELLMNKLWLTLEMLLKNFLLKKVVM